MFARKKEESVCFIYLDMGNLHIFHISSINKYDILASISRGKIPEVVNIIQFVEIQFSLNQQTVLAYIKCLFVF